MESRVKEGDWVWPLENPPGQIEGQGRGLIVGFLVWLLSATREGMVRWTEMPALGSS